MALHAFIYSYDATVVTTDSYCENTGNGLTRFSLKNLGPEGKGMQLHSYSHAHQTYIEAMLRLWWIWFNLSWQVHGLDPLYESAHAASVAVTLQWPFGGKCQQQWVWLIYGSSRQFKIILNSINVQTLTFTHHQWSKNTSVCKMSTKTRPEQGVFDGSISELVSMRSIILKLSSQTSNKMMISNSLL